MWYASPNNFANSGIHIIHATVATPTCTLLDATLHWTHSAKLTDFRGSSVLHHLGMWCLLLTSVTIDWRSKPLQANNAIPLQKLHYFLLATRKSFEALLRRTCYDDNGTSTKKQNGISRQKPWQAPGPGDETRLWPNPKI